MNVEDYYKLVKYVAKFNSWKNNIMNPDLNKPLIKYVHASIDTRTMLVYTIKFNNNVYFTLNDDDKENFKRDLFEYVQNKDFKSKYMIIGG